MIRHCTEFADLDNCNLVVPETVLTRSTLVYSGAKGHIVCNSLANKSEKNVCVYMWQMLTMIWVKVRGVGNIFVLFFNF